MSLKKTLNLLREAVLGSRQDFTEGSIGRAIVLLSVPMILEMVMESLFGIVNVFYVASLGAEAIATVGLTESMLTIVFGIAIGLSMATTATVARRTGEHDPEGAAVAAVQSIIIGFITSLPLAVAGLAFASASYGQARSVKVTQNSATETLQLAEVLAFHESVPGHHTQIALAQETTAVAEFRKHLGVTAFVEGWALYTERLTDEMGLYSGDLDRMGMLSFDAWRASRLVVDTGVHVKGWSRQRAVAYMLENTALAENNIHNEVDRYIGWPGQALAYKLGQREVFALRAETARRLGRSFDIRSFHDVLLENGAVSLPVLRGEVERWAARVEKGAAD